jgi:amidase
MPDSDLPYLTLTELGRRLRHRELSPVDVTRMILERIERLDARLHSYMTVLPASALAQAAQAEAELARGDVRGPLHGVPIGIKDLCATKGMRTTCGTLVLSDWVPDYDATVVERLVDAGAVILGKLKLTEGAHALHHPEITPPVNPWNSERWTGASSSGSGVATAAGLCYGSLGTDTGGSIRYPSACNGVVGIKPTYGRVSRYGVFPLAASLDHVGPMTRSVADAAAILQIIAGFDARDPTSRREPVPDYSARLDSGIRGVRIGIDEGYCTENVAPQVSRAVLACADVLRDLGAETREILLPPIEELLEGWTPFTAVEAALAHDETFPAQAERYGPSLRRLLETGLRLTAVEYAAIQSAREIFRGRVTALFDQVDLILCPSMPFPPVPAAVVEAVAESSERDPSVQKFTAPFDFSGNPTLSLPCGFTDDGLPLSLQLVARHLDEELLCRAGFAFEQATEWHTHHPDLG